MRPGLTKAVNHTGEDLQKLVGLKPLAPGETIDEVKLRATTIDSLDMLTLGLFRTEAGKQIAVSTLTGMKESVDLTGHAGRMVAGMEQLDVLES